MLGAAIFILSDHHAGRSALNNPSISPTERLMSSPDYAFISLLAGGSEVILVRVGSPLRRS